MADHGDKMDTIGRKSLTPEQGVARMVSRWQGDRQDAHKPEGAHEQQRIECVRLVPLHCSIEGSYMSEISFQTKAHN